MATMPTDPNSPTYACDMATFLREAYYNLVSGQGEKMIRYKGPNGEREVQFTQANVTQLWQELQKWEAACYAANNPDAPKATRFAIRSGSALRRGPYGRIGPYGPWSGSN